MKKIKNRILPQDDSQEATILKVLMKGRKISNMPAVKRFDICRLSAVIQRLRLKNWNIKTIEKKKRNGGTYGEYKLIR